MKKGKKTEWLVLSLAAVIFIAATMIFFIEQNDAKQYTIEASYYEELSDIDSIKEQIEVKLNINFDDLLIKNGGEITVDENGNIKALRIDFYYKKDDVTHGAQLEKNGNVYYLTDEKISEIDIEENSLSNYLYMLSFLDCSVYGEEFKIIFSNEYTNIININLNTQKFFFTGKEIIKVESTMQGLYIKATVLMPDNSFQELYFQVE